MRRKHSKLRMGFRGRSGFMVCVFLGTAVLVAIYYAWSNYFGSAARVSYTSVQGIGPGHMEQWDRERQVGIIEEPPIGLNKEIEMQMANEQWKKAKALQDRIDEERIAEEKAAQGYGKNIDNTLKRKNHEDRHQDQKSSHPLLFREADSTDGEYFSKLERIVHLDLKGAPPLVSYLEKLFPLLKTMGATGILMEYEDMFPYFGNLSVLASGRAYSLSDLQRIQTAAKDSGLEIIPLVQTFGHMEFVLKFKEFSGLREHDYTPQVLTPVRGDSYMLIYSMLEQVLKAHPESRRIHLGCDEVYGLGQGQSNTFMTSQRMTPGKLFLQHVAKVARHLKSSFPGVQSLIWDDWLRSLPYSDLADSELPGLVEPVVWYYQHDIFNRVPPSHLGYLQQTVLGRLGGLSIQRHVWATGSAQILTNATVHLDNNLQWVSIIRKFGIQASGANKINFRGIMFTGWQRYDHFAALCELLPVGLPSLSLSMQALKSGGFGREEMKAAGDVLKCSNPLDLEFPALVKGSWAVTQDCRFPGSPVLYAVQQLWGIMEAYRRDRGLQERISGWMTDFHVQRGISNPGQMKTLVPKLNKVITRLRETISPIRRDLTEIYDKWTVDEWIATNIEEPVNHLTDLHTKAKKLLEPKHWPARPFPDPSSAPSRTEGQPEAVQVGGQPGPHNVLPVNARQQMNPYGVNGQGQVNVAHGSARQQGVGMVPRQGTGSKSGLGNQGVLSGTLLKTPGPYLRGRPSGPSKMQYADPKAVKPYVQNAQRQQPVNYQVVLGQSGKGQQELRQYVRGLPQAQNLPQTHIPPPSGQSQHRVNQNLQGAVASRNGQLQNQHSFLNQQVQRPQGLGQNSQRLQPNQQAQGSVNQYRPLSVEGPPKGEHRPISLLQQVPPARGQRGGGQGDEKPAVDTNRQHSQLKFPDDKNKNLKRSDLNDNGQEDAGILDAFIGRRYKHGQEINDKFDDHKMRNTDDYNDDDDEQL
ncbi:uncharacterized protein LOC143277762 [Babylonia areolata]|uniref:uncharacterized protein LOC143277762 n=1 Tax=Babylonia areolata TaxID=304850 RepID=UPI003FD03326